LSEVAREVAAGNHQVAVLKELAAAHLIEDDSDEETPQPDGTLLAPTAVRPLLAYSFIHLIHSGYFYSASLSPLLLRGPPDTTRILCWSFTPKHHRELRVKTCPRSIHGG